MSRIGIFDSGFGGLSILKEIVRVLPEYSYIYLGDTARAPYGNRSQEIIYEFTKEGIEFLFRNGCDLVILACNTASSEALRKIQQEFLPKKYPYKKVLGVIIPGAEEAVLKTKNKKIGVLATEATVSSGAFKREIQKLNKSIKVFEVAAPMLVPLVEAGEDKSESAKILIRQYVIDVCRHSIDTLVLGCTHYGILESEIKKTSKGITILSEGKIVAKKLKEYLERHDEIKKKLTKKKSIQFYTTDSKDKFDRLGSRFFGEKISSKKVDL
ncbi:MAG: Glutamate racemase [Candidatus Taylorbacteria bacterium]|nr:Glutamate racemase [Candidatus Taylorbacteria bacterium]